MKLDLTQLEASFFFAQKTLEKQNLPDFMKDRWWRALEKAKVKLIEQPFFSWHPNALTIVSIPHQKKDKSFCSFYQVTGLINQATVRRFTRVFRAGIAGHFCFWESTLIISAKVFWKIPFRHYCQLKLSIKVVSSVN